MSERAGWTVTDSSAIEAVTQAIAQPCGRCSGRGTESHQVSRDPRDGYKDWPCPNCRGVGLTVVHGTPDEVARAALDALANRGLVVIPDEPHHYVVFDPERWTVEHSVACRLSGQMTRCEYHTAIARVAADGVDTDDFGRWRITSIDREGLPSLEKAADA